MGTVSNVLLIGTLLNLILQLQQEGVAMISGGQIKLSEITTLIMTILTGGAAVSTGGQAATFSALEPLAKLMATNIMVFANLIKAGSVVDDTATTAAKSA